MHERDTPGEPGTDAVGATVSGDTDGIGGEVSNGERRASEAATEGDGYQIVALDEAFASTQAPQDKPLAPDPSAPGFGTSDAGAPNPRPRRSYARRAPRSVPSADVIAGALIALHGSIALVARDDIWNISPVEAKQLSMASHTLLAEYGGQVSTRALAWANFSMAVLGVYGMRALAVMVSKPRPQPRAVPPRPPVTPQDAGFDVPSPVNVVGRHG